MNLTVTPRMEEVMKNVNEDKYEGTFKELRALTNDLTRQLLSSCINLDDKLMESGCYDSDLLATDEQISCAIKTLLKIRSIVIYYNKHAFLLLFPTTLLSLGYT